LIKGSEIQIYDASFFQRISTFLLFGYLITGQPLKTLWQKSELLGNIWMESRKSSQQKSCICR